MRIKSVKRQTNSFFKFIHPGIHKQNKTPENMCKYSDDYHSNDGFSEMINNELSEIYPSKMHLNVFNIIII